MDDYHFRAKEIERRIMERVPATYLKALFAASLASQYVYRFGLDANEITFYEFLKELQK